MLNLETLIFFIIALLFFSVFFLLFFFLNNYKCLGLLFFIGLLFFTAFFLSYDLVSESFYKKIKWGDDLEVLTESRILAKNKLQIFNINRYSAAAGTSTHYTPLLYILWIPFLTFFNDKAEPYLLFGFLIHAINTILLFLAILKLTKNKTASFLGSALFLFFPGNLSTIGWISASFIYAPTVFFMLVTLLCFIKYLEAKKIIYFLLSLFFYLLGCLIKQVFYPFFLILIGYEVLVHKNNYKKIEAKLIKKYIPFVLLSAVFVLIQLYRYKMGWIYQFKGGALFHPIIFYRLLDFIKEFLWPFDSANYYLKSSLILFIFISFYYLFFYAKNNILKFPIIWILVLGLLPMSQHLRTVSESVRYVYPISPGFFMLAAFLYVQKKWLIFVPFFLITIYFMILYNVI